MPQVTEKFSHAESSAYLSLCLFANVCVQNTLGTFGIFIPLTKLFHCDWLALHYVAHNGIHCRVGCAYHAINDITWVERMFAGLFAHCCGNLTAWVNFRGLILHLILRCFWLANSCIIRNTNTKPMYLDFHSEVCWCCMAHYYTLWVVKKSPMQSFHQKLVKSELIFIILSLLDF